MIIHDLQFLMNGDNILFHDPLEVDYNEKYQTQMIRSFFYDPNLCYPVLIKFYYCDNCVIDMYCGEKRYTGF